MTDAAFYACMQVGTSIKLHDNLHQEHPTLEERERERERERENVLQESSKVYSEHKYFLWDFILNFHLTML